MVRRIHPLDSLTIDQIAAGEVIDVPASCVKELVENSLDAGADDIVVEVSIGGRERIRVRDNGCGMGREDLIASIERYSTSKLHHIDDLQTLSSRGFRGEALASIVSISHVTITSAERRGDDLICPATTLVAEGGKLLSITETTAPPGTTVEVASLFFNVPARRKFLKSPAKDSQEIIKAMTCLALAAPVVAFRVITDGRSVIGVAAEPPDLLKNRIRTLFKEPFQDNAFDVAFSKDGFSLNGVVADPRHARSTRSGQYIIVNGRPVTSLPISYAVKAAFATTCEEGKHPVFALHLSLDPSSVDVNVHPQKREVRFSDEEWVRMLVQESVSEALFGKRGFFPACSMPLTSCSPSLPADPDEDPFSTWRFAPVEEPPSLELSLTGSSAPSTCLAVMGDVALIQPPCKADPPFPVSQGALLLLDLRQVLRAIIYREWLDRPETEAPELLLVPVTFDCSAQEAALIVEHIPQFEKMGIFLRAIGSHTFLIEGVFKRFVDIDLPAFCLDLVHEGFLEKESVKEQFCKRMATSYVAAMRGLRPPIAHELALSIVGRWAQSGFPAVSPDGKPCFSQVTPTTFKEWIAKGAKT